MWVGGLEGERDGGKERWKEQREQQFGWRRERGLEREGRGGGNEMKKRGEIGRAHV